MNKDDTKVTATIKIKLNKYDGEKVEGDGKIPVEVIEREFTVPYEDILNTQEAHNAVS